jgi:undecaprenyl pyrophosphate phosphatase UppP
MSAHLTYVQAVVTGLIQGVTELFPVSSLGHNVLIPALVGGSWANTLNVSAPNSPYLAFIVGLHVATAIAMIAYFWRDWLRIVRGFFTSLRTRSITTPDERLAWMIILATIPVGIVGLVLQKEVTKIFAKPELAAFFLAVNGVILLVSERMRRARGGEGGTGAPTVVLPAGRGMPSGPVPGVPGVPGGSSWGPGGPGGPGRPVGPGPDGWSQQPRQQQWQGPDPRDPRDPRYGQDPRYQGDEAQGRDGYGRQQPGGPQYGEQQYGEQQHGQPQYGQQGYGQPQYGQPQQGQPQFTPSEQGQPQYGQGQPVQPQYGQEQYGWDPRGGQPGQGWQPPAGAPRGYDPRDPQFAAGQQRAAGRHGHGGGHAAGHAGGRAPGRRGADDGVAADPAVAADRRLSTMGYKRAVIVGAAQILALLPGISRDGIVTVTGMGRGLTRQDAVRFSFLLSAPVILAAGALKAKDLTGPLSTGIHGPILVGSLISGVGAYLSIRFLTKYFSEDKSLNPFGIYCLIAGLGSLAYLVLK